MSAVYEEGTDAFVLVYTTGMEDEAQRMVAHNFNDLAAKFAKMNIKSVRFIAYDANTQN